MQTDRTVANSKPDSVMCDDEKGIDVVIRGDRNVIERGAEKTLKYKDCTVEIERMWTVNTKVIPVIIGATGTV